MTSMQTKTRGSVAAIIILFLFTLFLGSCGQDSSDSSTASTADTSSDNSSTSNEGTTVTTLSAPSGLSATAGSSQAVLTWSTVSGASSYTLFWKTSSGVSSSDTSIASISTNSYTHTSLTNGTVYYYKVAAVDSSVTGALSSEVSTTPAADSGGSSASTLSAPANLTATATTGTATLDWDAVSGATSYTLYWGTSSGITSSSSAITSISTDNYTHSSLSNGSTYYYKVAAVDSSGIGTLSSEVSASPVLSVPANLSATSGNAQTSLDWDAVTGATSYTLFWGTSSGINSSSSSVTSISTDNYTHTGLTNGTVYYYKIAGVDSSTGTLSAEVSATPVSPQMGGAIQGTVLSLSNSVTLEWKTGFKNPRGITTDGTNIYLASTDKHKIIKIVISSRSKTTLAGSGDKAYLDATGTAAKFEYPKGLTTDGTNLYVVDSGNSKIRKIVISTGVVSTIASGFGGFGITMDATNLYVADTGSNIIRKIVIADGTVSTFAGSGSSGSADDSDGTLATFDGPRGIVTDGTNLYVTDFNSHLIRQIVIATGAVTTLAGSGSSGSADHTTGTLATFNMPVGITTDGTNLYVADQKNDKVRQIVISTGVVTTLASGFDEPQAITTDGTKLYVANTLKDDISTIE